MADFPKLLIQRDMAVGALHISSSTLHGGLVLCVYSIGFFMILFSSVMMILSSQEFAFFDPSLSGTIFSLLLTTLSLA